MSERDETDKSASIQTEDHEKQPSESPKKQWVQFDDDDSNQAKQKPESPESPLDTDETASPTSPEKTVQSPQPAQRTAVLTTETTHVNLETKRPSLTGAASPTSSNGNNSIAASAVAKNKSNQQAVIEIPQSQPAPPRLQPERNNGVEMGQMRTIELSTGRVREGFANGDVIVTLLPVNRSMPWITPPTFRPELVPEELMAQGLTLTVEEYVHAMETLVNDYRFTMYNICYKRVLVCWILFAFGVLLGLLFSGLTGITLFALGVTWLFLNAATVFLCMWIKIRLARGLEKCLASVNKQLIRHKILVVLDDRGRISCHKVNLCFIYYDSTQCVNYLNEFIERTEQNGTTIEPGWESRLDVNTSDIIIQGATTTRLSRKQGKAEVLFLRYSQRWGKDFLRRRLDWILEENGMYLEPRHLQVAICPCQYAEEVVKIKPRKEDRFFTRLRNRLFTVKCC